MTQTGAAFRQPPFRADEKRPQIAQMQAVALGTGQALRIGRTLDGDKRGVYDGAVLDVATQRWRAVDPPNELPLEPDLFWGVTLTAVEGDVVVLGGAPTDAIVDDGKGGLCVVFPSATSRWHSSLPHRVPVLRQVIEAVVPR